jgi:GntR family transcriptional regulator
LQTSGSILGSIPGLSRYAALAAALRDHIVAGHWPAGSSLPAEQSLAAEHQVALGTLRQALALLVEQGFVERRHGQGTFVKGGLAGAPMLRFFRFGGGEQTPQSRIVNRKVLPPPAEVANALALAPRASALRLERLRSLAGQARLHEFIWLPLPLFKPLAESDTRTWGDLLYPLFLERCGVHVHRAVDQIGFASLNAAQARALGLAAGHPCARVQRQAFDIAGHCVEWRVTLGDANAFHYTVEIT